MRKEISQYLQTGQEAIARIKLNPCYRNCPSELLEAVASIIFASPRCSDVPELLQVRNLFTTKYGKDFVSAAAELRPDSGVNRADGSIPMLAKDPPLSNPTNISSPKIGQLEPKEHNNPASIRESPFSTPKNIAPKSSDIQRPSDAMERAKAALATAEHALAAARAAAELSKVKLFTQESPKQSD
ncbi:hypothetical protein KFK09_028457 [Dendrobium nobile]|uniref:Uncharacterized protein n=1 Tax=Dendrobium nobile TaxID=94219 RepID=A0A8T3A2I8_DENNO|nr:hypothetical protein KFK09_028457 [Dendrobium nobile]